MKDIYMQEWSAKVEDSSSGRIFKYIKIEFKFENYLDLLDRNIRICLTKIRLSSHTFYIERGRWENIEREDRKCSACGVLEDEYHCLIKCTSYINERMNLLPEKMLLNPSYYDFLQMFKSNDVNVLRNLGKLCLRIMAEHRSSLYLEI